ncbi:NAD(P)H-binding protein [Streptomyces sp. NPDC002588]|uniref:NmrA family NAD(P)-binding protein n=1 Tax=Streptomyces sp. NPDC002588 TaxID=3154419 RepID=UPI00332CF049
MSEQPLVLVTGATGNTGAGVVTGLRSLGWPVRAASRHPDGRDGAEPVTFDWTRPETFAPALRDVERIYLVAPVGVATPEKLVRPFFDLAVQAGVRRVVLLSSSAVAEGDPALGQLHQLVRKVFPEWTVLRPSWFMQNFVGSHPVADAVRATSRIVTATGDGKVGFIDAADISAVAVAALTRDEALNTDLVLTGPQSLSYPEVAAVLSEAAGRTIEHVDVTAEELARLLTEAGYEAVFSAALASLDDQIRAGSEAAVSPVVEELTGRAPRAFGDFVRAHRDRLAPVTA